MNPIDQLLSKIDEIESRLGYHFKNKNLLVQAFVHRSFFNEHRDLIEEHNERLEFLGDSILGMLIAEYLYQKLPKETEGQLSHYRSYIVEASNCANLLGQLEIGSYMLLGRGEKLNEKRGRESIFADLFEAVIGAIYLDSSFETTKNFFFERFTESLEKILENPIRNYKAELQDFSQKKYQKPPVYKVTKESGPEHSKVFQVTAYIGDAVVGEGIGSSKKEAEQAAAEDALRRLDLQKTEEQ